MLHLETKFYVNRCISKRLDLNCNSMQKLGMHYQQHIKVGDLFCQSFRWQIFMTVTVLSTYLLLKQHQQTVFKHLHFQYKQIQTFLDRISLKLYPNTLSKWEYHLFMTKYQRNILYDSQQNINETYTTKQKQRWFKTWTTTGWKFILYSVF